MPEDRKNLDAEVDQLQEMANRLEGDPGEDEAVDLLEEAVERVEDFGKRLEEKRK